MKQYRKPECEFIAIEHLQIIAASLPTTDSEANDEVGALINRRRGSVWTEYEKYN